ncbi:hypothetical protein OIU76_004469 [Salix suchowensis]|nr:hypothetical protein OIU76_004469 [Salix suchowensis]
MCRIHKMRLQIAGTDQVLFDTLLKSIQVMDSRSTVHRTIRSVKYCGIWSLIYSDQILC